MLRAIVFFSKLLTGCFRADKKRLFKVIRISMHYMQKKKSSVPSYDKIKFVAQNIDLTLGI